MKPDLELIDRIILIYILLTILYIVIGWTNIVNPVRNISVLATIAVFITAINLPALKHKIFQFMRDWYPLAIFSTFFELTTFTNRALFHDYIDPFFQTIDQMIFGYQPAIVWGTLYDSYFLQEFFHFSYFSYYLMIPGLAIYYYVKDRKKFNHYVFTLTFVFVACNFTYNLLPVIGGRYWESTLQLTKLYRYGPFTHIMAFIYNHTEHWGGAFPSSHVAIAFSVMLSAFHNRLKIAYLFMITVFFLSISIVFCHYHYFIDIIGGIIYAIVFVKLANNIYKKRVQYVQS